MVTLCAKECYRQTDGRTDEQIIFYSVTFMYKSFLSYFSFYNQQNSPFFYGDQSVPLRRPSQEEISNDQKEPKGKSWPMKYNWWGPN